MANQFPFMPKGPTVKIAATTATTIVYDVGIVSSGVTTYTESVQAPQFRVANMSTSGWANVVFGTSAINSSWSTTAAYAPGTIVAPQTISVITPPTKAAYASVSLSSGTGAVYLTPGEGIY